MTGKRRVVVIGGGVAGLTTAYRLLAGGGGAPDLTVLEADARVGGKLGFARVGDLLLEAAPDSFVARKPWAAELCRDLGIDGELVLPGTSGAYVWTDRGLLPLPGGAFGIPATAGEFLWWPGLSWRGKLRALADLVKSPRGGELDEPIGGLLRRRLGDEIVDMLVAPILGGLFAGDVDRLSVRATFPELAAWERDRGSLIRGARAAQAAARGREVGPMFLALRGGMERLIGALVEAIGRERLVTGARVTALRTDGPGFAIEAGDREFSADCVVLATPAFVSADLLVGLGADAVDALRAIPYASTGVVLLVYPEGTGPDLPEATGFVVPRGMASMTACTWVSRKWPRAEFGDRAVMRCYIGGVGAEDVLDAPDEDIVEAVSRHLAAVLKLPPAAESSLVVRWERAMPQYEVGHVDLVERIERALPPGVFVTGSAYRGAGIADCVRGAGEVAGGVLAHLAGDPVPSVQRRSVGWTS